MSEAKRPRVVAIIQARMSSNRLPGKVMLPLAGKPVLWHVVQRTLRIRGLDEVVVATSTDQTDDVIENWCAENKVNVFRGALDDVLDRYIACSTQFKAEVVMRITADCPLLDPVVSHAVLESFLNDPVDYAGLAGEFPDGLDTTVYKAAALLRAGTGAKLPSEREHIGLYLERNPHLFVGREVRAVCGMGDSRWTLDEQVDYEFMTALADYFHDALVEVTFEDLAVFLQERPEISRINSHVIRNEGLLKSVQKESETES